MTPVPRSLFVFVLALFLAPVLRSHSATYIPPPPVPEPYTGPVGGGSLVPTGGSVNGGPGNGGGGGGGGGETPGGAEPGRRPRGEPGGGPAGGGGPVRPGGGGVAAGGTGGRGGATTGGKKGGGAAPDWRHWWELNDDRFIRLRARLRSRVAATADGDTFLDVEAPPPDMARVTAAVRRQEIVPALAAGLKDPFADARAGAVIALGKAGDPADDEVLGRIRALLADQDRTVRESACLGLGLLGNPAAAPEVLDIAGDTPKGRALAGAEAGVPARLRCFAAVAAGMIGARNAAAVAGVAPRLLDLARDREAADVRVGALLALQLLGGEGAPALFGIFDDPAEDRVVRAHAAIALGKARVRAAVPALTRALDDRWFVVRQASATALGLLATRADADVAARLVACAAGSPDRTTRNLALVALGEIGHPDGKALLLANVRKGGHDDVTWSALALGVLGQKFPEERNAAGAALIEAHASAQDAEKPALALGLGLIGHEPARDLLRAGLAGEGKQEAKAHVALALGLLGDAAAVPRIRELVTQKADPELRRRAAVALGLLRDPEAVALLHAAIRESKASKSLLGGATVALGLIGDRSAVPVLREMLEDPAHRHQDLTRAFAAVALGFLGDKDEVPLLSRLHESAAYTAATEAFTELLSIL